MLRFSVTVLAALLWMVLLVILLVSMRRSPGHPFRSINMFRRFRRRLGAAKLAEHDPTS